MLQSLHVGLYFELVFIDADIVLCDLDVLHLNFILEHVQDLADGRIDAKHSHYLGKVFLILVQDRKVQDIMDKEVYKLVC